MNFFWGGTVSNFGGCGEGTTSGTVQSTAAGTLVLPFRGPQLACRSLHTPTCRREYRLAEEEV